MEVVGAAASVIAVVQIADRIIDVCRAYITGVHDAPADLRVILIEVGSVKCVLEVIALLGTSSARQNDLRMLSKLQSCLTGCQTALAGLEVLLPAQYSEPARGWRKRRQKLKLSLEYLDWPSRRNKALKLLAEIGRHKSTLSLGLTTEAVQDLKLIQRNVETISQTTTGSEMNQILGWLVRIDPSPNHNNACHLHEEHTGKWLTQSPEYLDWKAGHSRFLWLHGIPGAGKTILHSYIAEDLKGFCRDPDLEGTASVYFYCYFGNGPDQTPSFLRWVISQLCRHIGGVPSKVREIFKSGHQPRTTELLDVLTAVITSFSRIYITIDALDEAVDREQMLKALCAIFGDDRYNRIRLLATSRKELDIESTLLPTAKDVSLSNPYVDADIRTYVNARMRDEPRFRRWPAELRDEIETALVEGAKGMFRWAFCQLDILKRLDTAFKIRFALTQLPKTLDETYERILCSIPSEQQSIVYRTLGLIGAGLPRSGSSSNITIVDLADLLSVNLEDHSFSRQNQPINPQILVEACMCRLTYNAEKVTFAHYTVKEFLLSPRIRSGPAKTFYMTDDSMAFTMASCLLVYLLYGNYENSNRGLRWKALRWNEIFNRIDSESLKVDIAPLIIQLVDPTQPHFIDWSLENRACFRRGRFLPTTPGSEKSVILAYLYDFGIYETVEIFLGAQTGDINTEMLVMLDNGPNWYGQADNLWILHICISEVLFATDPCLGVFSVSQLAVRDHNDLFLKLLLRNGADANTLCYTGFSLLATPLRMLGMEHHLEIVNILLAHGADPTIAECMITPLQSLAEVILRECNLVTDKYFTHDVPFSSFYEIIRKLVDKGARINGTCCDEVNIGRIRWTSRCYFETYCAPVGSGKEEEFTNKALHNRGNSWVYSTPLRLLEIRKASLIRCNRFTAHRTKVIAKLEELEDLLKSYGAVSLHLFPFKDLPGYVAEDMEEWARMNEQHDVTMPSSFISLYPRREAQGKKVAEIYELEG